MDPIYLKKIVFISEFPLIYIEFLIQIDIHNKSNQRIK